MNESFTVHLNRPRVEAAVRGELPQQRLPFLFGGPHSSQPSFTRAGVGPGDTVYPITLRSSNIYLLCRFVVDKIVSLKELIALRPDLYPIDHPGQRVDEVISAATHRFPWHTAVRWTCSDHVLLPSEVSEFTMGQTLNREILARLTYRSKKADRLLRWTSDGKAPLLTGIDRIYRLAPSSAGDFAELFQDDDATFRKMHSRTVIRGHADM